MSWKIIYSDKARQDLRNIYEYIAYDLLVPETATGQVQRIMRGIRTLDKMPVRHRLYEEEPWHSQGIQISGCHRAIIVCSVAFCCYLPKQSILENIKIK